MIVAAAVCPHPPLLVPELAAGAASELDMLRHECDQVITRVVVDAAVDAFIAVGVDDGNTYTGFAPWGVDLPVAGAASPLSLLVGQWLLARNGLADHPGYREQVAVPQQATATTCAEQGARLAAEPRRLALLVFGDGSRCRGRHAPGYDDPRAKPYDEAVAQALADVDVAALLGLDPDLSAQLGVAGRAAWQVLAGAVQASGGRWRGQLHYHDAPYGVAYLVASWWSERSGQAQ